MVIPRLGQLQQEAEEEENDGARLSKLFAFVSVWRDRNGWVELVAKKKERGEGSQEEAITKGRFFGSIYPVDLISGKVLLHMEKVFRPNKMVVSGAGGMFATFDRCLVYVWLSSCANGGGPPYTCVRLHHLGKNLSTLAIDQMETRVAAGAEDGEIRIWHNVGRATFGIDRPDLKIPSFDMGNPKAGTFNENDDAQACTRLHWHADEVSSILFSEDGSYLFSGGREAVLVIWQLDTGVQSFLSRLGGPIIGVAASSDPNMLGVLLANNAVRLVNVLAMSVIRTIRGIAPRVKSIGVKNRIDAAIDPKHGLLALPTYNSFLQFYDMAMRKHIRSLQIERRNYVSLGSDKRQDVESTVSISHVVFSPDASVMVTVDVRVAEDGMGGAFCLKFWQSTSDQNDGYELNTRVDDPHSAEITALLYHPSRNIAVTASMDGMFKVWSQKVGARTKSRIIPATCWVGHAVGGFRNEPLTAGAISHEGSLLAVSASSAITLWNMEAHTMLCALPLFPMKSVVTRLTFIHDTPFLVSGTDDAGLPALCVWNMLTLAISWSYRVRIEALAADARSGHFAVICLKKGAKQELLAEDEESSAGYVIVFHAENPEPLAAWSISQARNATLLFTSTELLSKDVMRTSSDSLLVVVTSSRHYVVVDPFSEADEKLALEGEDAGVDEQSGRKALAEVNAGGVSAYEALYGKVPLTKEKTASLGNSENVGMPDVTRSWGSLLSGPSYALPSLVRICPSFMEAMLEKRSA
ncbi:hypothetical protein CBR_g49376 [Chara braunii]|uniref:WD repeat-containing protein 75 second beta-propeller domain-containing protein n=1 Tax=Chara braunii TaxID=69332 RepID=A0A388M4W6_CHABU|nr:hypothetical protein CBR_g49376 [Chara braunii]|eukprot:GBG89586.1 hypothetical protein CBR_g49376 [Chara braunii]